GAAGMAADLPTVEDQGQRIGQNPDHRQYNQSRALVDGGMFEVAVAGDGLKHLGIDAPSTAAELLDEHGRDGAEFEIGGVKVGALQRHVDLSFSEMIAVRDDRDLALVLDASRFDHPHQAIGGRPSYLWHVATAKRLLTIGLDG